MRKGQHVREHTRTSRKGVTFKAGSGYMKIPLEWELIPSKPNPLRDEFHWKNKFNGVQIWRFYEYKVNRYRVEIAEPPSPVANHGWSYPDAVGAIKKVEELMNQYTVTYFAGG